jgi:lipoprotein-releasing system permease protein
LKFTFQIAFRHLRSPQQGSFSTFAGILAILGLGIGIAALILTFSIIEGFETTISDKIARFDGHLRIEHYLDAPMKYDDPLVDSLLNETGISLTSTAFVQNPALLRKGQQAEGVVAVGLDKINGGKHGLESIVVDGSPNLITGSAIIGKRLARDLGVKLNDKIVLFDLFSMGQVTGNQRLKQFSVSGFFHSGLLEYDRSIIYIPLTDAQYLFRLSDNISGRIVTVQEPSDAKGVYDYLDLRLGYPYYLLSWKDKHRVLFDWINLQKWPILIIFGLIAFVGIVNIISSLSMIIFEKLREIGTLLAIGTPRRIIRRIFLLEGLIIGSLGSMFGTFLALLIAYLQIEFHLFSIPEDIYFMDHIPIGINILGTLIIFGIGILSSVFASLWPTFKANRIQPAEALRYE